MEQFSQDVIKAIVTALKEEFKRSSWWSEVQDDVKTRIEWVVDNIQNIGALFSRTYLELFKWEYERRKLVNKTTSNPLSNYITAILGIKITEEAYQCGILPTRALLDLYDYVNPKDADVTACIFLCNKIDQMQKLGVIEGQIASNFLNLKDVLGIVPIKNNSQK